MWDGSLCCFCHHQSWYRKKSWLEAREVELPMSLPLLLLLLDGQTNDVSDAMCILHKFYNVCYIFPLSQLDLSYTFVGTLLACVLPGSSSASARFIFL